MIDCMFQLSKEQRLAIVIFWLIQDSVAIGDELLLVPWNQNVCIVMTLLCQFWYIQLSPEPGSRKVSICSVSPTVLSKHTSFQCFLKRNDKRFLLYSEKHVVKNVQSATSISFINLHKVWRYGYIISLSWTLSLSMSLTHTISFSPSFYHSHLLSPFHFPRRLTTDPISV